jgi:UDP-N-acetylglucosamine diphosphorylase/glucosamine-1-phosphate N-acetyltransferase
MRICVFEDSRVAGLEPLTATRPAFDLRCGASTLLQRQCRYFKQGGTGRGVGAAVRSELAELCRLDHPGLVVNDSAWWKAEPVVLVNARWLPGSMTLAELVEPCVGLVGDQVAFAIVPSPEWLPDRPEDVGLAVEKWKEELPSREVGGAMIDRPWDLLEQNAAALEQDWEHRRARGDGFANPSFLSVIGPRERLLIDPAARVEPMTVVDVTKGPVLIDCGAVVQAFSRLEGPCHVGPDTHLLGAKVRGVSFGPQCRIGGEVEATIVQGYSNKAHDGFLGHSYLGEWVNLGAGTQVSDLRNDYAPLTVTINGARVATDQIKLGVFLGDHTKTSIGTLINAGSVVGVFCQLLTSGTLLPREIPSFCRYGHGQLHERPDLRQLFTTAATVMTRRGRSWTEAHEDFFFGLYEATAGLRRLAVRESEQRRLRRFASGA